MSRSYSQKKQFLFSKFNDYLDKYNKIVVVGCDNVTSRQFNKMRIGMRPSGEYPFEGKILMGKNTMLKKCLAQRATEDPENDIKQLQSDKLRPLLIGNVGLIFTNDDLSEVEKMVKENVVQTSASVGAVAPTDVYIPSGNTGLEPGQTTFFQALNIHTKIAKGAIEILNDVHLIKEGEKVGQSQAMLLQKLKIRPFYYGLTMKMVYDQGSIYSPKVLRMTEADKLMMVQSGISKVAALSLALGWTTEASIPHLAVNSYKNVFSISLGTDYDFSTFGADQLKADIKAGKVSAAPAAAAASAGGAAPAAAAKAPEPEPESEEEEMGMDLFD